MLHALRNLISERPPDFAFEVSDAGLAWARPKQAATPAFAAFGGEVLNITPLRDNVARPDLFEDVIARAAGPNGSRNRRRAVVILPDFSARVAVLDFDSFPKDKSEQLSLIRFRMKKSVPFDVESAVVRYHPQPAESGGTRVNVAVIVAALEIVARYEAAFRTAGLHPGMVTTSTLAALELVHDPGLVLVAKMSGRVLSASVVKGGVLRMLRTVELPEITPEEVEGVLFPTLAYVEDEFGSRPGKLIVCGLDEAVAARVGVELNLPVGTLQSRWGTPSQSNAGLLGFLESVA